MRYQNSPAALKRIRGDSERQHERQWCIEQSDGSIAFITFRHALIFSIDQHGNAANFLRDA